MKHLLGALAVLLLGVSVARADVAPRPRPTSPPPPPPPPTSPPPSQPKPKPAFDPVPVAGTVAAAGLVLAGIWIARRPRSRLASKG